MLFTSPKPGERDLAAIGWFATVYGLLERLWRENVLRVGAASGTY